LSAYRIERELGRGGMAVVYEAWHERLGRRVALKVLAAHLADDAEFRKRFLREARIAARLTHPNLVRTYDIDEHDGLPCIVMELLPGGTLEGGTLTREEASRVAAGLAHAHRNGVVHRDLKPANILRDAAGAPKIADFGIARAAEETMVTQVGTVLGTLRYLSPEQAAGHVVGPPADVYSLGVVLDELLAGRTAEDTALLERCRADDPELRPTAADVAAALDGDTLVAPPARHRTHALGRIALLAALLAAVVVAVAVAGFSGDGTAKIEPVPHGTSASQQAANLGAWLEKYSK
jgi:serine/threonine protein kinase